MRKRALPRDVSRCACGNLYRIGIAGDQDGCCSECKQAAEDELRAQENLKRGVQTCVLTKDLSKPFGVSCTINR